MLKLGDSLQQNRKLVAMAQTSNCQFLFTQNIEPNDPIDIEDDELLKLLIEVLKDAPHGNS